MSVIDEGLIVVALLKQLGVNVDTLIQEIERAFINELESAEVNEPQSAESLPDLDSISVRITKLLVLEDKNSEWKTTKRFAFFDISYFCTTVIMMPKLCSVHIR